MRFKDNIYAADLAKIKSLSSKNRNNKYYDVCTKFACLNAIIEIVNEANRKSDKLYVDQGREF